MWYYLYKNKILAEGWKEFSRCMVRILSMLILSND